MSVLLVYHLYKDLSYRTVIREGPTRKKIHLRPSNSSLLEKRTSSYKNKRCLAKEKPNVGCSWGGGRRSHCALCRSRQSLPPQVPGTRAKRVTSLRDTGAYTSSQDHGTLCLTAADSKTQGLFKLCVCVQPEGFVSWQGRAGWHRPKNVQAGHSSYRNPKQRWHL